MSQFFNTVEQDINCIELQTEQAWIEVVLDKLYQATVSSINANGKFNIAVSGGSTPGVIFHHWTRDERMLEYWSECCFYWVDERVVSPNHPDSNYGNALKILGELPATFHPMYNGTDDLQTAVDAYKQKLITLKREDNAPVFDMVLLGMGEDGHTASLFPDTKALQEIEEWVVLSDVPQLNISRITLTYPVLMTADSVLVLCSGESKKRLLQQMRMGTTGYPIQKLMTRQKPLDWIYY